MIILTPTIAKLCTEAIATPQILCLYYQIKIVLPVRWKIMRNAKFKHIWNLDLEVYLLHLIT